MDDTLICPYCGQEKNKPAHNYCGCHICGYKSAVIKAADGGDIMVVDRRMPYLERRCQQVEARFPDMKVIVDRRIAQDDIVGPDRRQQLPLEITASD